jgi:hypothetical protein
MAAFVKAARRWLLVNVCGNDEYGWERTALERRVKGDGSRVMCVCRAELGSMGETSGGGLPLV